MASTREFPKGIRFRLRFRLGLGLVQFGVRIGRPPRLRFGRRMTLGQRVAPSGRCAVGRAVILRTARATGRFRDVGDQIVPPDLPQPPAHAHCHRQLAPTGRVTDVLGPASKSKTNYPVSVIAHAQAEPTRTRARSDVLHETGCATWVGAGIRLREEFPRRGDAGERPVPASAPAAED